MTEGKGHPVRLGLVFPFLTASCQVLVIVLCVKFVTGRRLSMTSQLDFY